MEGKENYGEVGVRWGLSIDIEGFSSKYEYSEETKSTAIMALHELMDALIKIGTKVFTGSCERNYSERIFAHQFGDGFVTTSNFYEKDASRCVAIAIALMRHLFMKGYASKAAISVGKMSDIKGCYPKEIKNSGNGVVRMGRGLMTTIPVMGTALTRSHKLLSKYSGANLVLDSSRFEQIPETLVKSKEKNGVVVLDWTCDDFSRARDISNEAGLIFGSREALLKKRSWYISQKPVPPDRWVEATKKYW